MTTAVGEFQRVAQAVAERASDLLKTQVWVTDKRGNTVASGRLSTHHLADGGVEAAEYCVRVPLRLDGEAGSVLVAQPHGQEPVSPRLARGLVELLIDQAAVMDRLPNQREMRNKFIRDLLREPVVDPEEMLREAHLLGMDFSRPRAVILVDAADYILSPRRSVRLANDVGWMRQSALRARLIIASIVSFFQLPDDTICAYIGDGEVVVLKAATSIDLAEWADESDGQEAVNPSWANLAALKRAGTALLARLRRDTNGAISLGIGRYHRGIQGLGRSYQDARAALTIGRHFQGHNRVHCLDGLGIAAFVGVSDERTKVDLAMHLLSPLDHEEEMLETLKAFFDNNCSPSATAEALSVHRNTLAYRLEKIASLTGLDPRRFDDAVQIRLALVLRSLGLEDVDCALDQQPRVRREGTLGERLVRAAG